MRTPNVKCIICGKPMYRRKFEIDKARYFACYEHREIAKKMFPPTQKQLDSLELGREKGTNHLEGIPKSEISKKKRSKTMKRFIEENPEFTKERAKNTRGEKHYNWKGGQTSLNQAIRSLHEIRKWQQVIKKRDKRCTKCGSKNHLESHHIISVSEMIDIYHIKTREDAVNCKDFWNLDNGITLCRKCHYELEGRTYAENQ